MKIECTFPGLPAKPVDLGNEDWETILNVHRQWRACQEFLLRRAYPGVAAPTEPDVEAELSGRLLAERWPAFEE